MSAPGRPQRSTAARRRTASDGSDVYSQYDSGSTSSRTTAEWPGRWMKSSRFCSSSRTVAASAGVRPSTRAASSGNDGLARSSRVGIDSRSSGAAWRTSPADCVATMRTPFIFLHVLAASASFAATTASLR